MIWEQRVPTIVMLTRIFEGRVRKISKVSCVVGMMWLKLSTSWFVFADVFCRTRNHYLTAFL